MLNLKTKDLYNKLYLNLLNSILLTALLLKHMYNLFA